jgi:hypothetical protein
MQRDISGGNMAGAGQADWTSFSKIPALLH